MEPRDWENKQEMQHGDTDLTYEILSIGLEMPRIWMCFPSKVSGSIVPSSGENDRGLQSPSGGTLEESPMQPVLKV